MADRVEKNIELNAAKANIEIDKLVKRLDKVNDTLLKIENSARSISFEKFVPAINSFANSFNKLKIDPTNLMNIQTMAQALNRFKMTAVELNKSNLDVSFAKITRGIYSFMDSVNRMDNLNATITKVADLARAINRLSNASINLQNMKVSYTSLTQAIYAFTGSILRIKRHR